jgi:hypothetical protein
VNHRNRPRHDRIGYLVGLLIHHVARICSARPRRQRTADGVQWMAARRRVLDPVTGTAVGDPVQVQGRRRARDVRNEPSYIRDSGWSPQGRKLLP